MDCFIRPSISFKDKKETDAGIFSSRSCYITSAHGWFFQRNFGVSRNDETIVKWVDLNRLVIFPEICHLILFESICKVV